MSTQPSIHAATLGPRNLPSLQLPPTQAAGRPLPSGSSEAEQLRAAFTQFVGETFFGQMLRAMRSTVGQPAYFHGGRAEEAFRGQLDQALAEQMTHASAERFAKPLFRQQFPNLAQTLGEASNADRDHGQGLNTLNQLTRR